jgi:alpha-L-rhamnosidase
MLRRARFIWTPRQPVDTAVTFNSLVVGGPVRRDDGCNRWYLFRREFELPAVPEVATLQITADSRYALFVNGQHVARGPARAAPAYLRVDMHDVVGRLRPGRNVVAVLVHVYGVDTAWYEVARDYAQSVFGDGGLYLELRMQQGSKVQEVVSDASWRVQECPAWRRDTPRCGWGQGFIEDHDARLMPQRWTEVGFDDRGWDPARPMLRPASDDDRAKGWGDIEPFATLVPSAIPPLAESERVYPVRLVAVHEVVPAPALGLERRIYDETHEPAGPERVERSEAPLRDDDSAAVVRTDAERDVSLLYEFETRHAGYPFIELEAQGGEIVEVAVAETIPGQYASAPDPLPRVARQTRLDCAHVFRYTARPGRQRFEKFDWTAVKFLQVVVRNAPQGLRLLRVGSTPTHFPVQFLGRFECSDAMLTRLWDVGRHTTLQCTHDAWEDCPGREKRQWLGDGIVHYLIDAAAFGPGSQAIDREFLVQATESQRADGLMEMFAPGDHHRGGIVIPDFCLHWICAARDYLMHTGDLETIEAVLPAAQRVLAWFERHRSPSGLLANVPHWHFIEWARVGREGEAFIINALWLAALEATATLAEAVGYERLRARMLAEAEVVRRALRARHYDAVRRMFVDAIDPVTGRQHPQVSQQANSLAILCGIAEPGEWPAIIERVTDTARLRLTAVPPVAMHADPFVPATDVVRANTYFSHFVYAALGHAGRFDLAIDQMRLFYGPMLATGTETLWESFDPVASLCHAFSATAVYQLSAHVLGVTPVSPGFVRARVAPQPCGLAWARGAYPTPHGAIEVDWRRRDDGQLHVRLVVPQACTATFEPPSGFAPASPRELAAGLHEFVLAPHTAVRLTSPSSPGSS